MNNIELLKSSLGLSGSQVITDTSRYAGSFKSIYAFTDTVFDSETLDDNMGGDITGITLLAGQSIGGNFSAVKLTSGTVIAYK